MEWVELGRIGAPYGIRGWVHVESHTDPPEGLLGYGPWVLKLAGGRRLTCAVADGRTHGNALVASLEGVTDRDAAAALTGATVEVERAALPAPKAREYYRTDLIGMAVRTLGGADLGVVSHFVDMPQGAVMVVKGASDQEHWILAQPPHLQKVDLAGRAIVVDWPVELE